MSRLDRLVLLLDTGSSAFVRNTAADQLADVQKSHPEDLLNLLGRVFPYLKSKKWDTRIAAARAIGGIVSNADKWDPNDDSTDLPQIKQEDSNGNGNTNGNGNGNGNASIKQEPIDDNTKDHIKAECSDEDDETIQKAIKQENEEDELLSFANLDICSVIKLGGKLLGSTGKEYDDPFQDMDPIERLKRQKLNLRQKLGMAGEYMSDDILNDVSDISSDNNRATSPGTKSSSSTTGKAAKDEPSPQTTKEAASNARLRAMAKRKARNDARSSSNKIRVVDISSSATARKLEEMAAGEASSATSTEPPNGMDMHITEQSHNGKVVIEHKAPTISPIVSMQSCKLWPFEGICELMMVDLFDETWEIRHGAALGLREIIKVHGAGAGRMQGKSKKENDARNFCWLEDLACRLCCIFALDRFGDFVSDQVVAPVRESAAQTLAALLLHLPEPLVYSTFVALQQLVLQKDLELSFPVWEICHGGMLGLRYLVSVRPDVLTSTDKYFDGIVQCVLHGLKESDDDVQAMAAATLIPVAKEFVEERPHLIGVLLEVIWDSLGDLKDDLSASIGNVMDLLAKLCGYPQVLEVIKEEYTSSDSDTTLNDLVPRLYPFLRHSITNVRKSVLKALDTFIDIQGASWIDAKVLRLVFQNLLVEQNQAVLELSLQLCERLLAACSSDPVQFNKVFAPNVVPLLTLLMTPVGAARHSYKMDVSLFIKPSGVAYSLSSSDDADEQPAGKRRRSTKKDDHHKPAHESNGSDIPLDFQVNIDNPMLLGDVTLVGFETFLRTKIATCKMLAKALCLWDAQEVEKLKELIAKYLSSSLSSQKLAAALLIEEFGKCGGKDKAPAVAAYFSEKLLELQKGETINYGDLTFYLRAVRTQCQSLLNVFIDVGKVSRSKVPQIAVVVKGEPEAGPDAFSLADGEQLANVTFEKLKKSMPTGGRIAASQALSDAHKTLLQSIDEAKEAIRNREIGIMAAAANAYVLLAGLPEKVSPLIKALMDSIKEEEIEELQARAAHALSELISMFLSVKKQGPADKVVKNLCTFLCVDTLETPEFHYNHEIRDSILSLKKEESKYEGMELIAHQRDVKAAKIKKTGAKVALSYLIKKYGGSLFESVPKIKECMFGSLVYLESPDKLPSEEEMCSPDNKVGQMIIDGLSVIRTLLPDLDPKLHTEFTPYFAAIQNTLWSQFSVLRYAAAKCLATICQVITVEGISAFVENVIPMVSNALDLHRRQGAVECIYHLTITMGVDILPYIVFLIVPVLGRMSDSDKDIRILATTTFASIIKLVPLEAGIPDPPGLPTKLLEGRDREREFISQMMDHTKVKPFEIPVAIKADLRKYQQDGVNWLAFLNKYHLHGVLCDDMGLGKTLQTICIIASDHYLRAEEHKKTQSIESRKLPSLVVCPPSLTGHWIHEIGLYAPFLKVLHYVGNPASRAFLASQYETHDVVVTSYDIARNDVQSLSAQNWNYCVLDEGHVIKNANSKLSKAVKTLSAYHRLILSGTPIQNNVLELWSLFDFLMPGFLGNEKAFYERFAKPIAASRNSKSSSKEQESGALALEALHKQVLPFLLRRMKEDVLSDLPPKIIQDYYCELSDLQKQLYENFVKQQKSTVEDEVSHGEEKKNKQHIFQALHYMRKLCNHPALVLNDKHPMFAKVTGQLKAKHENLKDIKFAPKLQALQELLLDCGIGTPQTNINNNSAVPTGDVISQHRALIFCQLREMLDMVENDLLKKLMPSVSYMRLDGSTEAKNRQGIVQQFNNDPSIDCLLLTTHVGGLGLNLTGADTVIFVEHDWNPMNDLQAMDRAHRIGQKKVVNVYRLITRGTLEEKIMGLQKFKMNIASSVVNQQNSGLGSMDTDQLLDLFNVENIEEEAGGTATGKTEEDGGLDATGQLTKGGKPNPIADLGDLWDEKEYEEEYNLDNFIQSLKS